MCTTQTVRVQIRIERGPDQERRSVDPDLGRNCLQRLSADDQSQ